VKPEHIIIVDDGSDNPLTVSDIPDSLHSESIQIISLPKADKTWVNPCVPFNVGFWAVTSDVTIIQNPECYHHSNVVDHVKKYLTPELYLSYACYALAENEAPETVQFQMRTSTVCGQSGWYNHTRFRPTAYHFTSAIFTEQLKAIGGFDEDFSQGIAFDDDEILWRIRRRLRVGLVDDVVVLHQYHYSIPAFPNSEEMVARNRALFHSKCI
jgi:hypothetical protein